MSRTIVPRSRSRSELEAAPAKLVATLLSVAAAGLVDGGRFRRGREYATQGNVVDLRVEPGSLHGTVQGSRADPYVVEIETATVLRPPITDGRGVAAVVPDVDELGSVCSCPEGGDCKHVVAVLLAFAAEAGDRPDLLLEWRCGDQPPRASIGSRAGRRAEQAWRDRPPPTTSPFETPAWQAFFGLGLDDPPLPDRRVLDSAELGTELLGPFDVTAMVRSMHAAMRSAVRRDHPTMP